MVLVSEHVIKEYMFNYEDSPLLLSVPGICNIACPEKL